LGASLRLVQQFGGITFVAVGKNGKPTVIPPVDPGDGREKDAFQSPPLLALGSQWFGSAHYMLDVRFA
jgi:hypothetical protein